MKRWGILALALLGFGLTVSSARAEDSLQKQLDDLKDTVDYIRHNYEPAEPVEEIKQVTEWVSPSGELFTERQKGDISPTDGSALAERTTYRKMKFPRRELVADKIAAAIQGNVDAHLVPGLNMVGVYQNLLGQGDRVDYRGLTRSANRGAFTGTLDLTFVGKPMLNTAVFVDLNSSAGPGIDGLAPNTFVLNNSYIDSSSPTVRQAWVATHTPKKILGLQLGVIDLGSTFDMNAIANDETSQFLTGAFVNSPLLERPANGAGAVGRLELDSFSAKIGVQNSVPSATETSDLYSIAELDYRYHFFGDAQARLWARQEPRGLSQPDQALGLSVDQRFNPQLTAFGRYAKNSYVQDASGAAINAYDWAASAGLEYGNFSLAHLKDRVGIAYGRNDLQTGSHEDCSEIYYKTVLTTNFTVSLHGQGVFNRIEAGLPSGAPAPQNIYSLGLRTQVSY